MNKEAFIRGFVDEMGKEALLPAVGMLAARLAPALLRFARPAAAAIKPIASKALTAAKPMAAKAWQFAKRDPMTAGMMAQGITGSAANLGSIMKARMPQQPAEAGNTITTP